MSLKRKADDVGAEAKKAKTGGSGGSGGGTITAFFGAPKAAASAAAAKFDKAAWAAKLTAEQRELLQLELDTLDESWLAHLHEALLAKSFLELKRFLRGEMAAGKTVYPPLGDVYAWSRHTPLHAVKAVVVGQDPYHGPNQAHGLSFSVRPPTPAPPSLRNMYRALRNDYPDFAAPPRNSGLLTPWADRGVLLLNTVLTVERHKANAHQNRGWERFTQKVIDTVAKVRTTGVVFLAWGTPAANRVKDVNKDRHLILKSVHPSPLSASRGFVSVPMCVLLLC